MLDDLFKATTSEMLNQIDMATSGALISEDEFRGYYVNVPGREHYRLLAYIASKFSGSNLLDIGTFKGCSALALSLNPANTIHTFDLADHRTLGSVAENVRIYHDDILEPKYRDLILSSPFIMVDTFHDGIFEGRFLNYLRTISYEGYVLLDDIYLNAPMRNLWASIPEEKYDISSLGHTTGTGLVVFGDRMGRYRKESYITAETSPFGFWETHANRQILDTYAQYIKGRVLDLGCNHGASTYWLARNPRVDQIIGLDLNKEALSIARSTFAPLEIPHAFVKANLVDGYDLPEPADTIITFHTLEHIFPEDVPTFLATAYRALVAGGYMIVSIPYETAYPDPCHVSFFNEKSLSASVSNAGFQVVECFKDDRFMEKNLLTGLFRRPFG